MKHKVVVEVCRLATVMVEADNEDEAYELAEAAALADDADVDWGESSVNTTQIVATIEDENDLHDIAYDERKDEQVA